MTDTDLTNDDRADTARPATDPTSSGTVPDPTRPDPGRRAETFAAGLPDVADRPRRHESYARAGLVLMAVGLATAVIATVMSQVSDNPLDQSTQISLGIAGVCAVGVGGVVFLRYSLGQLLRVWLLLQADERRRGSADVS